MRPTIKPANGISIHAPREGSDAPRSKGAGNLPLFLSTLPVRGATHGLPFVDIVHLISIHAPREGSDVIIMRR